MSGCSHGRLLVEVILDLQLHPYRSVAKLPAPSCSTSPVSMLFSKICRRLLVWAFDGGLGRSPLEMDQMGWIHLGMLLPSPLLDPLCWDGGLPEGPHTLAT